MANITRFNINKLEDNTQNKRTISLAFAAILVKDYTIK